ncbi:phenylalanine 4-monooxygenase [Sphingomonas xanthus]|uniref:Phenylalanine 4-monooxygenase n=1 Tax=Sphingomonas xanthus TaxID=2594473 RepID=A0A516IS63_9SPHN|nr:phenylalanine 4-monooxygenase [Sphingomonas xanthus]QDP19721.1 phenylalanine 4-monooxygenase [Sphingomonas xanthus]
MFQPDFQELADPQGPRWTRHLLAQRWERFTAGEHEVWDRLFARQLSHLGGRIVGPFFDGIDRLGLDRPGIPELARLNTDLEPLTGWQLVSVAGLVPDDIFFAMLADRTFPIGNFIRGADCLDYLEQPDCFHDIFGHVPMLADPAMARLMEALGRLGVEAIAAGLGDTIARIYWHSVEFGLAHEGGEVKILGAGLASSFGESHFALEAGVARPRFTLRDAAATSYRSDAFQPLYFVSDSLESVADQLEVLNLDGLRRLAG